MVRLPRGDPDEADRSERLAAEWQGPQWPVWRYALARPGEAAVRARLGPDDHAVAWTEGLFVNISTPQEDPDAPRMYRPSERATELLRAALAIDPREDASLLAFVNCWGVLGVGLGTLRETATLLRRPWSPAPDDSVWATRRAFEALQTSFRWLRALQARRWASAEIPSLAVSRPRTRTEQTIARRRALIRLAAAVVPPPDHAPLGLEADPADLGRSHVVDHIASSGHEEPYLAAVRGTQLAYLERTSERDPRGAAERHWRAFASALTPHLRSVHPGLGWLDGPIPQWVVARPIDAAWVTLWDWATRGARLRRCQHCKNWFPQERPNKTYCSPECANRATSARWYRDKGKRLRQQRRRKARRR